VRHEGRRLGVAFGYNRDQSPRYGVIDFEADKILIPLPAALRGMPSDLRRRSEGRSARTTQEAPLRAGP
jgi:hypothetical protein